MLAQCSKTGFTEPIRSVVISNALEAATLIQRSQTRAPSRVAPFLIARHEERTQVRDETNTCFFTRRGNKKKKKLYEKCVRSSDVQEKNENAGGNIRFSVLQLRMLAQIFYSHWRKKKKLFSDGLPSKCIFSRYGTHACVRIPTASSHVCACRVSSRNITCVYKALSTVLSHSTSSLQLRFELILFILLNA